MALPHIPDDALEAYLMGRLPPASEAAVEEHLLGCEHCIDRIEDLDAQLLAIRYACARSRRIAEKVVTIAEEPQKPTATRKTNRRLRIIAENVAAVAAAIWLIIMIPSWFPTLNQRPAVREVTQSGQFQPPHSGARSEEALPLRGKAIQAVVVSSIRPPAARVVRRARGKRIPQPMTLPRMGPIRPFELPEERITPTPEIALLDAPPPLAMDDAEVDLPQIDPPTPPRPHGRILHAFAAPFQHLIRFLAKTSDSAEAVTAN